MFPFEAFQLLGIMPRFFSEAPWGNRSHLPRCSTSQEFTRLATQGGISERSGKNGHVLERKAASDLGLSCRVLVMVSSSPQTMIRSLLTSTFSPLLWNRNDPSLEFLLTAYSSRQRLCFSFRFN